MSLGLKSDSLHPNSFEKFLSGEPKICSTKDCALCGDKFNEALKEWVKKERMAYRNMSDKEIILRSMENVREEFMRNHQFLAFNGYKNKRRLDQSLLVKLFRVINKNPSDYPTSESLMSLPGVGHTAPFHFLAQISPNEKEYKKILCQRQVENQNWKINILRQEEVRLRNKRKKLEARLQFRQEKDKRSQLRSAARAEFLLRFRQMNPTLKIEALQREHLIFTFNGIPEGLLPVGEIKYSNLYLKEIEELVAKIGNRKGAWKLLREDLLKLRSVKLRQKMNQVVKSYPKPKPRPKKRFLKWIKRAR